MPYLDCHVCKPKTMVLTQHVYREVTQVVPFSEEEQEFTKPVLAYPCTVLFKRLMALPVRTTQDVIEEKKGGRKTYKEVG